MSRYIWSSENSLPTVPLPARISLINAVVCSSVWVLGHVSDLPRRARALNEVAVLERRALGGGADFNDRLAEQAERTDRRARLIGDAAPVFLVHFERDLDVGTGKIHRRHLADVHARDPYDRSRLEPLDILELRLQLITLPGKPALPSDRYDDDDGKHHRDDRDNPDFQFRPGKRSCSWHSRSSIGL